jgi:hypothetical protein
MKRRQLIQTAAGLLAAWGVSDLLLADQRQALAQSAPRKLALLLGVNQYANGGLKGCLTDLELQRQLLMSRFGFKTADILVLSDAQVDRESIAAAFTNHLTAQPGDVVLVHFSGYGSVTLTGEPCLMLADDQPLAFSQLAAWLQGVDTPQLTTVLDTSYRYSGQLLQGSYRLRAYPRTIPLGAPLDLNLPGTVLAASADQTAVEFDRSGFSAGSFTYALTQALWQSPTALTADILLQQVSAGPLAPVLRGQSLQANQSAYPLPPVGRAAAGVIMTVDPIGNTGTLWLGGLPASVIAATGERAIFSAQHSTPDMTPGRVGAVDSAGLSLELIERQGLVAKVRAVGSESSGLGLLGLALAPGQTVQEAIRVIPHSVDLTVALDSRLSKIERVDAISALSSLSPIIALGDGTADYCFGKVSRPQTSQIALAPDAALSEMLPAPQYGLFTSAHDPLVAAVSEAGAAVKQAVKQLAQPLQTLAALKLLQLTENQQSSGLALRAQVETLSNTATELISQAETPGAGLLTPPAAMPQGSHISPGSRLRYRLQNLGSAPLYWLLLGWESNLPSAAPSKPAANTQLMPYVILPPAADAGSVVAPGASLTLPIGSASQEWLVRRPIGPVTTYLVCSLTPFTQTHLSLGTADAFVYALNNPLETAQAILHDLQAEPGSDVYRLDLKTWATVPLQYQVG